MRWWLLRFFIRHNRHIREELISYAKECWNDGMQEKRQRFNGETDEKKMEILFTLLCKLTSLVLLVLFYVGGSTFEKVLKESIKDKDF